MNLSNITARPAAAGNQANSVEGQSSPSTFEGTPGKEWNLALTKPGQTFTGQVTDIRSGFVTIAVGEQYVTAKYDQAVNLCMGEVLTFVVKENANGQVLLAPYQGSGLTGEDAALYKALEGAGLPATDKNIDLISELLNNQMPVDKNTIKHLLSKIHQYPDAKIEDLALLMKHQIPITEGNLKELDFYKTKSHSLSQDIQNLTETVPEILSKLVEEGKDQAAITILKQIFFEADSVTQQASDWGKEKKRLISFLEKGGKGEGPEKAELREILRKPGIQEEIKKQMKQQLSLEPEKFQREEIQKTFQKIETQIHSLMEAMGKSTLEPVVNTKNNLDFMKSVNENFIYTQIPLKMKNQITDGELFVYTKRKQKRGENDAVSLLLHLNMEFLGEMNVMVNLKKQNLSLKFSMEKEEAKDLLTEHMKELTDSLKEKGFQVTSLVEHKEKEQEIDFVEDFLKQGEKKQNLKRFSFDMRA